MTADDSDSQSSRDSISPPFSRSRRNGTKQTSSSSKSRHRTDLTKIIQVANIAPQATREQMLTLFGYIGKVVDLRLYPTVDLGMKISSKICFVKFYDGVTVGVALHLTNTVFIDRALIIVPYMDGSEIPDEHKALELLTSGTLLPGIADPKLPQHVTSQIEGIAPHQVVVTVDPKLIENNLPAYPALSPNHDTRKIEEIRRTVLLANLDPDLSAEEVIEFFSRAGEVKYFRFCNRDNDPLVYALMEFSEQPSILGALALNGTKLGSKYIKVYHSTQAIAKPQAKTNEAAQKEIEEAMSRQAQNILSQGLEATTGKDKRRDSRSRSHSRSRGSRSRRSRSRSHRSRRSRSRSRSKSRSLRRSRSTSRHRSDRYQSSKSRKSRSRTPTKKSRSRSRERTSVKSKKRSRSRHRKSRSRSHSKRRSRSRSKKRDDKKKAKKAKKEKERTKDKDKERSRDTKDRDKDRSGRADKMKEKDRDRDSERRAHRENGYDAIEIEDDY